MATTYSWGYTNTTPSDKEVTLVNLGLYSNYENTVPNAVVLGKSPNVPYRKEYRNTTSPGGQEERITYQSKDQDQLIGNLLNPPKTKAGRFISVSTSNVRREVRDNGDTFDHPIRVTLSVSCGIAHSWTNAEIIEEVVRTLSGCYDETNDSWRFENLLNGGITPHND